VSPYRGLSQAAAEGMRSQPAQASPASAGNAAAVGRTEEERQAGSPRLRSNRPPRSSPNRHRPPRRGPEGRTASAPATRGDRLSTPNAPDEQRRATSKRPRCGKRTAPQGRTTPPANPAATRDAQARPGQEGCAAPHPPSAVLVRSAATSRPAAAAHPAGSRSPASSCDLSRTPTRRQPDAAGGGPPPARTAAAAPAAAHSRTSPERRRPGPQQRASTAARRPARLRSPAARAPPASPERSTNRDPDPNRNRGFRPNAEDRPAPNPSPDHAKSSRGHDPASVARACPARSAGVPRPSPSLLGQSCPTRCRRASPSRSHGHLRRPSRGYRNHDRSTNRRPKSPSRRRTPNRTSKRLSLAWAAQAP